MKYFSQVLKLFAQTYSISDSKSSHKKLMVVVSLAGFLSLTLVNSAPLLADIVDCNGVLTNKPCQDGRKVLAESAPTKPNEGADSDAATNYKPSDEKLMQRWMNDLEIKKIRYQRKHGVNLELELVRRACLAGPIERCDQAIKEADRELEERVLRQQKMNLHDKTEDEQKEASKEAEVANQTSVTVVNVVRPNLPPKQRAEPPINAKSKEKDTGSTDVSTDPQTKELSTGLSLGNPQDAPLKRP